MTSPETCPVCGTEVPAGAKACPHCGADEQTGWSDEARYQSLDLPNDEFDYDDFVHRQFGEQKPIPHGVHWFWWIVAILLIGAFVLFVVG